MNSPKSGITRDMEMKRQRMAEAMAGQRIGAPRMMKRQAGTNTRQAAPRKNKRGAYRG